MQQDNPCPQNLWNCDGIILKSCCMGMCWYGCGYDIIRIKIELSVRGMSIFLCKGGGHQDAGMADMGMARGIEEPMQLCLKI
jgi:hypothetical protein